MLKNALFVLTLLLTTTDHAQQPDKTLWYNRPAEHFEESLVLGNGTLGATVFGGVKSDKIYLNDATLWSGEPVRPVGRQSSRPTGHLVPVQEMPTVRDVGRTFSVALGWVGKAKRG